jgi:peroxiredoxin
MFNPHHAISIWINNDIFASTEDQYDHLVVEVTNLRMATPKRGALMKSKPPLRATAAIAALALFTIWITWQAKTLESRSQGAEQVSVMHHKPAPDFRLPALDGRTISLADYRGKKVVVSFWASWCGPCRLELPVLRSFFDKTYRRDGDFEILAINLDEDREAAEAAAEQAKLPFPVLLDPGQKIANAFGVQGIPALFVIDKTGHVDYGGVGFNPGLEYILAGQLGIDPKVLATGGPHVSASH